MEKEFVLGLDIGGTYTKLGLVSRKGEILSVRKFPTEAKKPFDDFKKQLESEINALKATVHTDQKILAIGVGAPNANGYSGNMEHAVNFRWGDDVPLVASIKKILDLPVSLTNDANASAVGELQFGMGKGMEHFVVLTLGTGLGSGIISNGELLIGQNGMAGEIGHVNVVPNGRQCNCGLKGCLETYVSVTGMRRTIFELLADMNADSELRTISFEDMTGEIISDAAIKGDAIALKAFEETAEFLGTQMADTAAHLDPEAFILLGGLSKAGDILLNPVKAAMQRNLFHAYKGKVKILMVDRPSNHSVLGAAALGWRAIQV
ncbi:ROK family protein [Maribacter halichondriae]|uniref:ROK family protein n=1 Tax=Maribacter halichondriae TaxID=2980554 RepID=UPI0023585E0D|nr:ROK family protein [Maribacter sp. Hal144]